MNNLPFSLNIFKQIEYFQDIKRLDIQFEKMLNDWYDQGFEKEGLSDEIQINYPTWEIEKKVLLWTALHHKHLGSPLTPTSLEEKKTDMHISHAEIAYASGKVILENLVVRGFGNWNNQHGGVVISREGLAYGQIISQLYFVERDKSSRKVGNICRDEMLTRKHNVFLGYDLMYLAGIVVIILSLMLLGISVFEKMHIIIKIYPMLQLAIKFILSIFSFLPVALFIVAYYLIEKNERRYL